MVDEFWRFLQGQKPISLKSLGNKNFAYIPCISLRTSLCWLSVVGNPVICILFLDLLGFADELVSDELEGEKIIINSFLGFDWNANK